MLFRKALQDDIPAVALIYDQIHAEEERGEISVGWIRSVYPTEHTAQLALGRDDLFVAEENGTVIGSAIINRIQVDVYEGANWLHKVPDEQIMVLHTLVISPSRARTGCGAAFVKFYEEYALSQDCPFLRMDTNARNARARALYRKLGYREADIVPCVFNGIEGVNLVLLEKALLPR